MAKIYADLIIAKSKRFSEVPVKIKEQVDNVLKQYVVDGKITQEQYNELIGE